METQKRCCTCKKTKGIGEFYRNRSQRDGLATQCKDCFNKGSIAYKRNNPGKVKEFSRRYYDKNKETKLEYNRQWSKEHWRERDPEKKAENNRKWFSENKEHVSLVKKIWYALNLEKSRQYRRTRRARLAQAEGNFTPDEFQELCAQYDNRCLCCHEQRPLEPDHVIPISKGGSNAIDNIQPLCLTCNRRKSAKMIDYRPALPESGN